MSSQDEYPIRRGMAMLFVGILTFPHVVFSGEPLREFAYRTMTLVVAGPDGKPVPNASVYGFCRELNLVWPRPDKDAENLDHLICWHESFLGSTGADGVVKVVVPPGKWGFFSAACFPEKENTVLVAWSDFRERMLGDEVRLTATRTRHWELRSHEGSPLASKQVFVKPSEFPIWIAVPLSSPTGSLTVAIGGDGLQLWAIGDATGHQPGFVLSWGTVSDHTADGPLRAPERTALVKCRGGKGNASLKWFRQGNFGLDGDVALTNNAKVLMNPGVYTLSYRRPIGSTLMGEFVGQSYAFKAGGQTTLNLDTALAGGVDHHLWKDDKKGVSDLHGRLYLVDGNGHLMARLSDTTGRPAKISASVVLDRKRFSARQGCSDDNAPTTAKGNMPAKIERGDFAFVADVRQSPSDIGAVWEFEAPKGVLRQKLLTRKMVEVTSNTFKMEVPEPLEKHARNILAQAEMLADGVEAVSGRKRQRPMTSIIIIPGRNGASASHSGAFIKIGTKLLFGDRPTLEHTLAHELTHNYGFTHGGLMELVVEMARCTGTDQISQQAAKWMFIDRMNGLQQKEVFYQNTGLYLYCSARGGAAFRQFVLSNEQITRKNLSQQGFSNDEITGALLNLAFRQDMTPICLAYGLSATPTRIEPAIRAARDTGQRP